MGELVKFPSARVQKQRVMKDWQGFYSISQVSRIARIPVSTLRYWKVKDVFPPSVVIMEGTTPVEYGYSYADLTIIRLMRALRDDRLNLKSVGIALRHLYDRFGAPNREWRDAHVFIVGNQVLANRPDEWETTVATKYGQKAFTGVFGDLFEELKELEEGISILIPRDYSAYVEINPKIMAGEPVVKGTRIPTRAVFAKSLAGRTLQELAKLYRLAFVVVKKVIEYEKFLSSPPAKIREVAAGR